jgi:NAD(P)-dependent dehydrogenase (short-subunit alcohol dehydrogenase family)
VSAFELAEHQITVNTVLPGAVITPGHQCQGAAVRWPCDQTDAVRLSRATRNRRCGTVFCIGRGPPGHQSSTGRRRRIVNHLAHPQPSNEGSINDRVRPAPARRMPGWPVARPAAA